MTLCVRRLLATALLVAMPARAQESASASTATRVPFGVGERLEYDIRFGKGPLIAHVGNGDMEVLPMDTVRGRDTWHTVFRISGGYFFYRVNDRYEDWFDLRTLSTLRYWQEIHEGSYDPKRHYEVFPERREFLDNDQVARQSVERPLDEGSFLYFLRTVPLRVGMDTSFNDYFMAERNPVRFKVLRRDTVTVPAGTLSAIVVQPIFASSLFSEGGHAEVWLSDDDNRIMLQMKSKVSFGSLNLYLKSFHPSPTASAPLNRVTKPDGH